MRGGLNWRSEDTPGYIRSILGRFARSKPQKEGRAMSNSGAVCVPPAAIDELQAHVVLEAMTLPERIDLFRAHPQACAVDHAVSAPRLKAWRHVLGLTDDERIQQRLRTLGIEECDLDSLLGELNPDAIEHVERPSWWDICEQVLATASTPDTEDLPVHDYLTGEGPPAEPEEGEAEPTPEEAVPFEHALAPWVEVGTQLLVETLPGIASTLGPMVWRREQRGLLENLCLLARSTILDRFYLVKLDTYDANDMALGLFTREPPRTAYIATVQAMLSDGWADVMRSQPALARLLATRVECWVRTLAEFTRHLKEDRADLEAMFNDGAPLGALVKGGRGISDSHNGGRAVIVCQFECGARIVYKPRSMAIDVAWSNILGVFNANIALDLQLRPLRVLDRGVHGWMEFAARTPCESEEEVRTFYRRMGSLLAVVHTLQGNDFHLENVVASGPDPVAIDLETISVPEPLVDTGSLEQDPAVELATRSVLRTLLLPSVMSQGGRGGVRSLGAVGIEVDAGKGKRVHRKVDHANTDFQRWATIPGDDPGLGLDEQSKVERSDGVQVKPDEYRSEVEIGYAEAYQSIVNHRDLWLSTDGPLAYLEDAWVRVLNRSTNIYYRILLETCMPAVLGSGVDRWIHGDRFMVNTEAITDIDAEVRRTGEALVAVEQDALLRGDIAYFIARGGGRQYFSPDAVSGEPVVVGGAILKQSAIQNAHAQVAKMDDRDLKLQRVLMNSSYLAAQISAEKVFHGNAGAAPQAEAEPRPIPTHAELEAWVLRALEQLDDLTIRHDGHANWMDATPDPHTETIRPSPLGPGIYGGRGGMAMMFERAYRHFGDQRWLKLAQSCVHREFQQVARAQQNGRYAGLDFEGPSGMGARPGLVASFWAIGRHEGKGDYRACARRLLTDMTDRVIDRDTSFDVIGGSAGYLLLAMHLEQQEPVAGLEPLLGRLGDHLLKHVSDIDGVGWPMRVGERPLNGFGHGRAGTGLALLQLGARLNRADLREVGLAALRDEHEMRLDGATGGWPDLRSVDVGAAIPTGPHMNAWCAGGEGIALSRASALEWADEAYLQDDLDHAAAGMQSGPTASRTHLCCGMAGRAEAWRTLSRLGGRMEFLGTASEVLAQSLDVHEPDPTEAETGTMGLALWQGTSGRIWAALSELMGDDGSELMLLRV